MQTEPIVRTRRPPLAHLAAALIAGFAWLGLAMLLGQLSRAQTRQELNLGASRLLEQRNQGVLLAREAMARPDLLLLYGSSELVRPSLYRAAEFFSTRPTGFEAVPIADIGAPPLVTLERLVSLGGRLRGRKLVIFVTPPTFTAAPGLPDRQGYLGTASRLQTGEALFGAEVDPQLRRSIALRLREFPELAAGDSFLGTALGVLSRDDWTAQASVPVVLALGRIQNSALELIDTARVLLLLLREHGRRTDAVSAAAAPLDFGALRKHAEIEYAESVRGHAFGFRPPQWADSRHVSETKGSTSDARLLASFSASPRWRDLDMIFALLEHEHADALVLSLPFSGAYLDHSGVSAAARQEFYRRVQGLAQSHAVRCLTLDSLEYETLLFRDPFSHPSPKGWIILDSIINDYYHDSLH